MATSLGRTTDTHETFNGHLWSYLCSKKYLQTEIYVLYITVNYNQGKQITKPNTVRLPT